MSCGKVYVGSIPGTLTEEMLVQHFQSIVPDSDFTLVRSSIRHSSTGGFGFLTLPTAEDVKKVLTIEHNFDGKLLKCEEYLTGDDLVAYRQKLRSRRVFIRNIKKCITDQDIEDFFSQFGKVESAYVVKVHSSNKSRSFGYVTFEQEVPAQTLVQMQTVEIKGIKVFVHPFQKNHESLIENKPSGSDVQEDGASGDDPTKNATWATEACSFSKNHELSENMDSTLYESPENLPRARICETQTRLDQDLLRQLPQSSPVMYNSKPYNANQVSSSRTYLASLEGGAKGPQHLQRLGLVLKSTPLMSNSEHTEMALCSSNVPAPGFQGNNPQPAGRVFQAPQTSVHLKKPVSGGNISLNWQNSYKPWSTSNYNLRREDQNQLKLGHLESESDFDEPQQQTICMEKPTKKAYIMPLSCKYNHRLDNVKFNQPKCRQEMLVHQTSNFPRAGGQIIRVPARRLF